MRGNGFRDDEDDYEPRRRRRPRSYASESDYGGKDKPPSPPPAQKPVSYDPLYYEKLNNAAFRGDYGGIPQPKLDNGATIFPTWEAKKKAEEEAKKAEEEKNSSKDKDDDAKSTTSGRSDSDNRSVRSHRSQRSERNYYVPHEYPYNASAPAAGAAAAATAAAFNPRWDREDDDNKSTRSRSRSVSRARSYRDDSPPPRHSFNRSRDFGRYPSPERAHGPIPGPPRRFSRPTPPPGYSPGFSPSFSPAYPPPPHMPPPLEQSRSRSRGATPKRKGPYRHDSGASRSSMSLAGKPKSDPERAKKDKQRQLMAPVAGALAGGFAGHQVGGRGDILATLAGAVLGALGANEADKVYEKRKSQRRVRDREWDERYGGRLERRKSR